MYPIITSILYSTPEEKHYSEPQETKSYVNYEKKIDTTSNFDCLVVEYFIECIGQKNHPTKKDFCSSLKDLIRSEK